MTQLLQTLSVLNAALLTFVLVGALAVIATNLWQRDWRPPRCTRCGEEWFS